MKKIISVVVPCYNEEEVIKDFYTEVARVFEKLKNYKYELVFVNDGSNDKTLEILKELKKADRDIKIISFSRNFGKESAIYAGLENSKGDLVVVIDADLQHPPAKIIDMVKGIEERIWCCNHNQER